jgi:hypothetical protein
MFFSETETFCAFAKKRFTLSFERLENDLSVGFQQIFACFHGWSFI